MGTFKQLIAPPALSDTPAYRTRLIDDSEAEEQVRHISHLLEKDRSDNWIVNPDR